MHARAPGARRGLGRAAGALAASAASCASAGPCRRQWPRRRTESWRAPSCWCSPAGTAGPRRRSTSQTAGQHAHRGCGAKRGRRDHILTVLPPFRGRCIRRCRPCAPAPEVLHARFHRGRCVHRARPPHADAGSGHHEEGAARASAVGGDGPVRLRAVWAGSRLLPAPLVSLPCAPVCNVYGATEMTPSRSRWRRTRLTTRFLRGQPGVEARGRLMACRGIAGAGPVRGAALLADLPACDQGWFATGDLAQQDSGGRWASWVGRS
jgi:hypothetical protein